MSGNRLGSGCTVRIVAGGIPKLLCRGHSNGGDLNQDFARLRLGNRTSYRLQVQFVLNSIAFIFAIASLRGTRCISRGGGTAKFLNSYVPPRKQYCFRQDVLPENCDPRHPKLGSGSENRCSFVLDEKYDEFCRFGLARITAHGVNVFRRFVKDLSRAEPLKRASAKLHLNFPF
jgi:hypothetical protein